MRFRNVLLALFLFPVSILWSSTDCRAHILDVAEGEFVSFEDMVRDLRNVPLVFMGELHDHVGHHKAQLQVIRTLHESGVPVAIGLEMFRANNQESLDRWIAGEIGPSQFMEIFNQNWGMWQEYKEIFLYAREEGIPMVGLNIPRDITSQVARSGFSSLSPEQVRQLPGVACDVDQNYEDFIRRSLGGHVHGKINFRNFCEAQMVWDTVMAHNILKYVRSHPDRTMIVLAGSGHAWKYGIPFQIALRVDIPYRVLLPAIPGRLEPNEVTTKEADYLMLGLGEGPIH